MERSVSAVRQRVPLVAQPVLFLSHSGVDADAACDLKRLLENSPSGRKAGLRVWLDVDGGLVSGSVGWQKQIEDAIDRVSTAFAVYVGSKGVVNWVENEVRLALSRATRDKIPFVPILAKETPSSSLPSFARQYQAVRDPVRNPSELAKLITAVLQKGEPPIIIDPPFVGLRSMTEEDALLFFGRDKELEELEGKLSGSRLVAVVADSGSGKSSLVRAGLIPRYRGGAFADRHSSAPDGRIWHVVVMRPGSSPVDGLRTAVTTAAEQRQLSFQDKVALINALDFEKAPQTSLALQCNLPAEKTETLLVVDQFEELFTQTPQVQRKPFIDWLLALIAAGTQPSFRVVLTIRSDHLNLCSSHDELFQHLSTYDSVLRLKAISSEGLADIVRQPLKLAGRTDHGEQDALIQEIRQQASDRSGDLALIQMALFEAWTRREAHENNLLESFVAVGGVSGALANAAEEVRTKLNVADQKLLESILVRLVVLGESAGATRRTADLEEFGAPDSPKRSLIDKLTHSRLLLTSSNAVEICHEQLVTQWPWWQTWITDHALNMRRLARLIAKARDWSEAAPGKRVGFLAAGADLEVFSILATSHPDWLSRTELDFVADSRRRVVRRRISSVAVASMIFLLIFYLSYYTLQSHYTRVENESLLSAAMAEDMLQQGDATNSVEAATRGVDLADNYQTRSTILASLLATPPILKTIMDVYDPFSVFYWINDDDILLSSSSGVVRKIVPGDSGREQALVPAIPTAMLHKTERLVAVFLQKGQPALLTNYGRILVLSAGENWVADEIFTNGDIVSAQFHAFSAIENGLSGFILGTAGTVAHRSCKDDVAALTCEHSMPTTIGKATSLTGLKDGSRFVYGTEEGKVFIGGPNVSDHRQILKLMSGSIRALSWSASENLLAAGSPAGKVNVVYLDCLVNCKKEITLSRIGNTPVAVLLFSPDGRYLAVGAGAHLCMLDSKALRAAKGAEEPRVSCFLAGRGSIRQLKWSPDSSKLASLGDDALLRVWSLREVPGAIAPAGILADLPVQILARDNNRIAAVTTTGDVWVGPWATLDEASAVRFKGIGATVKSVALLPNFGPAVVLEDGSLGYWETNSRTFIRLHHVNDLFAHRIVAVPGEAKYAASLRDGRVLFLDPATGSFTFTTAVENHPAAWGLEPNSVSDSLFVSFADGSIRQIGKDRTWSEDWLIPPPAEPASGRGSMATTSDGRHLAATGPDNNIRLYAVEEEPPRETTYPLFGSGSVLVDIDPKDRWLLAMDSSSRLYLWRLGEEGGAPFVTIRSPAPPGENSEKISAATFSPDGTRLVIALSNSVVSLVLDTAEWVSRARNLKVQKIIQ